MLPEDRLDALLASRDAVAQPYANPTHDDATFGPLLAAAARLAVLAEARPSAAFAQTLEDRLLARAAALADTNTVTHIGYDTPTLPGSDFPTLPAMQAAADTSARSNSTSARQRDPRRPHGPVPLRSRYSRLLPQAIAASLILILGAGALTAAAAAGPGSFLYPLHRFEQGIQLGLSGSPADRFKLHLAYALDALDTLDSMHGDGGGNGHDKAAYAQALTTLRDEEHAAERELAAVPPGSEHDALAAQLQTFETRATHDLYIALSPDIALSWQDRLATTQVLGQLGAQVPHIDAVHIARVNDTARAGNSGDSGDSGSRTWKVTISGTGFTPGAVVMIDGHVAGTVIQSSPTQIVALVKTDNASLHAAIGIEEPDGTAVQATGSAPGSDDHSGDSSAAATPTIHSGDGDSHSGDGHGGKGSGQGGTPTPVPSITPRPGN